MRRLSTTYVDGPTGVIAGAGVRLLTDPTFEPPGDYLVGSGYSSKVCLRAVTPASIVTKSKLMDTIERLTADPVVEDEQWRGELTAAVDALDALEKPFAAFDRERFGSTSRDRCVTAVRECFALDRPRVSVAALAES